MLPELVRQINETMSAVNNWGKLGPWVFHVCRDPQMLGRELEYLAKRGGQDAPAEIQ
jgi:hypothetical protein